MCRYSSPELEFERECVLLSSSLYSVSHSLPSRKGNAILCQGPARPTALACRRVKRKSDEEKRPSATRCPSQIREPYNLTPLSSGLPATVHPSPRGGAPSSGDEPSSDSGSSRSWASLLDRAFAVVSVVSIWKSFLILLNDPVCATPLREQAATHQALPRQPANALTQIWICLQ